MSKENAMDASRGRSCKGVKNRGVSAKCSRGSRSSGSALVALWGNVTAPTALICNETGGSACVDPLVGNLRHQEGGDSCTGSVRSERGTTWENILRLSRAIRTHPCGTMGLRWRTSMRRARKTAATRSSVSRCPSWTFRSSGRRTNLKKVRSPYHLDLREKGAADLRASLLYPTMIKCHSRQNVAGL
jgi:hypothetical protein